MELIGQRWNSGILLALGRGATRFTEILASVEGISDRMLSKRLRELQIAGLVERSIIPSTPVQVRYGLSERGRSLLAAIQPLVAWGHTWGQTSAGQATPAGQSESLSTPASALGRAPSSFSAGGAQPGT